MRIYELSKKINIGNKEIITKLAKLDITVKSHLSCIDEDTANKLIDIIKQKAKQKSIHSAKKESHIKEDNDIIIPEYIKSFGLKKLPFENVPDPKFFFDEGDYARIYNRITASLKAGRGLMIVTGPIGSGKTTMSQMIKSDFSNNMKLIWMTEPPINSTDLFLFISQELGLTPSTSERVFVLRDIRAALLKISSEGNKCLMIIDESHLMADDVLDGIRILNNLEDGSTKLIQILLLGQMEIMEKINRPEMKPFKQRIAALEIIGQMDADRIRNYISYRIEVAGGDPSIFTDTGWEAVVLASGTGGGIPRIINTLCDRSLNVALEREKTIVDIDDVSEVAEGMGIDKEIFHYKIALRSKEKKYQIPSNRGNTSIKEPEHSMSKESEGIGIKYKSIQSESSQSIWKESKIGCSVSEVSLKDLKIPMPLLLLFIMIIMLSIFFIVSYYA
jgi:general secretion pathway protein A